MDDTPKQTPDQPSAAAPGQPAPRRGLQQLVATVVGLALAASLVAVAAVTGLLPGLSSHGAPAGQQTAAVVAPPATEPAAPAVQTATAPPAAPAGPAASPPSTAAQPTPGAQVAQQPSPARARQSASHAAQVARVAPRPAPRSVPTPARAVACRSCGTVQSVVALRRQGHGTGLGAIGGAVAGGLIGNQFGRGNGRTGMTVLGAAGGGYAGNSVERRLRSSTDYRVRVRMANGKIRYFTYRKPPPYRSGERVRIERGQLVGVR